MIESGFPIPTGMEIDGKCADTVRIGQPNSSVRRHAVELGEVSGLTASSVARRSDRDNWAQVCRCQLLTRVAPDPHDPFIVWGQASLALVRSRPTVSAWGRRTRGQPKATRERDHTNAHRDSRSQFS